ncbi:MAG: thioesterase [bacterium]|nr:thioesterase [bacterium]
MEKLTGDNDLVYTRQRRITYAELDSSCKLGIAQAALLMQDTLTECFGQMKCDGFTFKQLGYFWVLTRSKVKFFQRPGWGEIIDTMSFPVRNTRTRTYFNTVLKDLQGHPLAFAYQEFCVLDLEKHRPVALADTPYPKEGFPEELFAPSYEKFTVAETEYKEIQEQTVRSGHLDMSHHLNNIECLKFALDAFPEEFLLTHEAEELELHYPGESREGQKLRIFQTEQDGANFIKIKESERDVFEMKIRFRG